MAPPPSVADLLDGHVALDVECFDRLYVNVYIPTLQTSGGVYYFLHDHRGHPIASPALFRPIGQAFRTAVAAFAENNDIPVIRFKRGQRKLDVVRPYLEQAESPGVVAIGVDQETQYVTMGTDVRRDSRTGVPHYSFRKVERRVTVYYFYIADQQWGPCFIKICAYFPYPAKMWANGHEWAKRQLNIRGIAYRPLANGLAGVDDPRALNRLCRSLSPAKLQALFDRWIRVIPQPLTAHDRAAGYDWELSMNQVEFSKTMVLDRPERARAFFEHVIADNVGLGRPSEVQLVFSRRVQGNTPGRFHTRIVTEGVEPACPSTTSTAGSRSTSRKGGPSASRPSSITRTTSGAAAGSPIWASSGRSAGRSTDVSSTSRGSPPRRRFRPRCSSGSHCRTDVPATEP